MKPSRILILLALAGAAGFGGWHLWTRSAQAPAETARSGRRGGAGNANEIVSVTASAVKLQDVPVLREGVGAVQAFAMVTVRPQMDGRLLSVEFTEGQEVKAGAVLARIDPAPLQAQFDLAAARQAQSAATLANARLDLERYERLAATNAGSRQQADQQRALVAQLEAQTRGDQASVDSARINLSYTVIAAPIDGRAGIRQVDAGNIVHASDPAGLVTLAQIRPIAAVFTLPQRDLGVALQALRQGAAPVEALDGDGRTVLAAGWLDVVDNQVDPATGTVKLKASFANEGQRLWPGQFVSVRLKVAELKGARTIPTPALRRGPSGLFVYVVQDGSRAVIRPVTTIQQDESVAVIATGLEPGEQVVTAGFQRLSDGKAISVAPDQSGDAPAAAPPPRQRTRGDGQGGARQREGSPPAAAAPPAAQPAQSAVRPPPGQGT
jgi:multidrug efflux system membrane fusion protein